MTKKIVFLFLILIPVLSIRAQEDENLDRARQVFGYVQSGDGESIIAMSDDNIRKHVSAEIFANTFAQLEGQFGSFLLAKEWETRNIGNVILYTTDVQFEKMKLRFAVGFDSENKINSITFSPVQDEKKVSQPIKTSKFNEESIQVITGDYKLSGILTIPTGIQNPPVVILVHGSGPHDRDETIGPNKPFRELAWGLADRGIAVIRYDKRTLVYGAESAPNGLIDMDHETVNDAISAINIVKNHKELSTSKVYILGHSQGALLAPRIAEREPQLGGIIMVAGNARPLEDVLVDQYEYLSGFPSSGLTDKDVTDIKLQAANIKKLGTTAYDESIPPPMIASISYWQYLNNYSQTETARKLKLPVFIIQGERDYQVTMEDFNIWKNALRHKENVSFKSYPLLNHMLHEGTGKATPIEYGVEAKIPDYVIDDISGWIKNN